MDRKWAAFIAQEDYLAEVEAKVNDRRSCAVVYPHANKVFRAFELTPFDKVRVVIIGQDPYHGEGQADGLCFSVPPKNIPQPSLRAILKEAGCLYNSVGDLTPWAEQGVMLLNAVLTVESAAPKSHSNIGWQRFTHAAIQKLSSERDHLVFMLWGRDASAYMVDIDMTKHTVFTAGHPSPLARGATVPFEGCQHFTKTNDVLVNIDQPPIDWTLPAFSPKRKLSSLV